jgi:signal transduction histidine kinase
MLRWYRNASLQTKFVLQTSATVLVVFAIVLGVVLHVQRRTVLGAVEDAGFRTADLFARTSVQALVADDYVLMQLIVNGIASDEHVLHAMLLREDGLVVAHSRARERGTRVTDPTALRAARSETPTLQVYRSAQGVPVYDFAVPVYVLAEKRAAARVGLSVERELAGLARTRNTILAVGVGVLALAIAGAVVQARRITGPVDRLVAGATALTAGDLDHRIPITGSPELARLAEAFNSMAASLQARLQEVRDAQDEVVRSARLAAMGEIAAAMAHETRNPLAALRNCVQVLARGTGLRAEDAELLGIMRAEARRLNDIVGEFLAFGRPRPPRLQDTDVQAVVDDTVALLARDDRVGHGVRIDTRHDPALVPIAADPDQLRQLLWNLCLNAVQAAGDSGGITIAITTARDRDAVRIAVSDDGPGIAKDVQPHLFEPFFTTRRDGTGLGLAIVARIVEDHGGRITVESAEGAGTTFTVTLPARPSA